MEAGIEAGHLRQLRPFAQQDIDGLQREWLVQWRERDVFLQIGEYLEVHANWLEIFTAAVDDPMSDRTDPAAVESLTDSIADEAQCGAIWTCRIQFDRERRNPGLSEIRIGAADSLHLPFHNAWRGSGVAEGRTRQT